MCRVDAYISSHLATCITMKGMAAVVHLSRHHFSRVFRLTAGVPPRTYLLQARLAKAKTMMGDSSLTLCEIALACGFADQSHLTRVFRRQMGTTPTRWRQHGFNSGESISEL
jgi:transcriptional regulator GlxA family with amidase domain